MKKGHLYKKKLRAFIIFEVLLALALFAGLITISFPVMLSFEYRNDLAVSRDYAVSAIRLAQINAQSVLEDTTWGVRINTGLITVFGGPSYAGRNPALDITYPINTTIGISGVGEILFSKVSGNTTNTGTTTFSKEGNNFSITINDKGNISY